MSEYTYADVIIDPNDERVKVGEKYYMGGTPNDVLEFANEANEFFLNILIDINNKDRFPFIGGNQVIYCCLIKSKESQATYVPFDLSKKEVRDKLRGQWIKENTKNGTEEMIINFSLFSNNRWACNCKTAEYLFENYVFLDGFPFGEMVEVFDES